MADGVSSDSRSTEPLGSESSSRQTLRVDAEKNTSDDLPEDGLECSVCLQTCVHPVQLPCSHIFCFLCIKGVANHSKKCALCRSEIPPNFLQRPTLLNASEVLQTSAFDGKYQWFYEGGHGWWQYDLRASAEIEDRYQKGEHIFEMLIAGFLYIVDIENMVQYRRNTPSRRRRIKRDLVNIPDKKGVAGLSYRLCPPKRVGGDGGENTNTNNRGGVPNQLHLPSTSSNISTSIPAAAAPSVDLVQRQVASLSLVDDGGRVLRGQSGRDTGNRVAVQPNGVPVDRQASDSQRQLRSRQTGLTLSATNASSNIQPRAVNLNADQPNPRPQDTIGNSVSVSGTPVSANRSSTPPVMVRNISANGVTQPTGLISQPSGNASLPSTDRSHRPSRLGDGEVNSDTSPSAGDGSFRLPVHRQNRAEIDGHADSE